MAAPSGPALGHLVMSDTDDAPTTDLFIPLLPVYDPLTSAGRPDWEEVCLPGLHPSPCPPHKDDLLRRDLFWQRWPPRLSSEVSGVTSVWWM